ncbi:OsmC family protein [Porphyromonadaceae bacterium W3.11]|nr:OsmC family protein [Porphyromonadaceae bacterium W3.11]
MADSKFRVKARSKNPTKVVVKARSFEMIIDEPTEQGGTNDGANPVEYVLAALSGCLNVMCHLIANEMGFTLRGVEIKIAGSLNSDKLMGKETTDRAGFKEVDVEIIPDTDADDDTLKKWIKVVEERCPVSDTISNSTPLKITLA